MISIKNNQHKIAINESHLKKDVQIILDALGYPDFDIGIWLTTNATIRKYNRNYRHKDVPTDILSFPFYPELKAGQKIKAASTDEQNLGDLIISLEYVQSDAKKLGITFNDRMKRLLVHGICHLLGYDHLTDKEYQIMIKKERELITLLGVRKPIE
ncbi:MAG: rRNA maturation RNase YbeY [Candidatus Babeliales bacterium]